MLSADQGGGRQAQPSWQNWSTRGTNACFYQEDAKCHNRLEISSALDRDFLNELISHDLLNIGGTVNLFIG